uniref:MICOS complex subunit MIC60 n=1 Tax=Parastrongyloides trichosuri TaxID=131310 RepID=A0A0N5A2I0_PARTI
MKKFVIVTGGTAAAAAGGTIAAAKYDPKYRSKIEETIPQTKEIFNTVLGPNESNIKQVKDNLAPSLTVVQKKAYQPPVAEKIKQKEEVEAPKPKKVIEVIPVDVKKPVESKKTDEKERANEIFKQKIIAALTEAQEKVKETNTTKLSTCEAIKNYTNIFKKAVDDGKDANWDFVTQAKKNIDKHSVNDKRSEEESLKLISKLEDVINEGKKNELTSTNPLLINATQTAYKLKSELDNANHFIKQTQIEVNILKDYKDLVEESRKKFLEEVNGLTPFIDKSADGSTYTEKELNNIIVHAHLKNAKLTNRLIEQELKERENVALAVERQRRADEELAKEKLQIEIEKVRASKIVDKEAEISRLKDEFEKKFEERLIREKAAHNDHIEKVIVTQKQIHDIENAEKVNEAIQSERKKHSEEFEMAISKLEGIEHALDKRAVLDIENRKAKQCWLACQNLLESIVYGVKSGDSIDTRRKSLSHELKVIKNAGQGDKFIESIINTFDKDAIENGVYTEQDLKNRFNKIYTISRRVAKIDDNGGGLGTHFLSYIQSFFMFSSRSEYSRSEKIDVNNISTYDILDRAKYFVQKGDLETAVKLTNLLSGEPKQIAKSWIKDTQKYLDSLLLAQLLIARAVVISACSVY